VGVDGVVGATRAKRSTGAAGFGAGDIEPDRTAVKERWGAPRRDSPFRYVEDRKGGDGMAYFKKYRDNRNEWRWTFYSNNGEEIAVSSEGYTHEVNCGHGIQIVKRLAPEAQVRATATTGYGR
jgi:uncharacterized protein YegP (UPF0339 family)